MTEMTMLDLQRVDLASLCAALEDHSPDASWWLDPRTGELEYLVPDVADEVTDPEERGLVHVAPVSSRDAYGDLEDFTARVPDPRARDLLERAIAGRGAFRRFKDTLLDFPELRDAWFAFHDARMRRRAIRWLLEHELLDPASAADELAHDPDPDLPGPTHLDAEALARTVADDLRALYGSRLRGVLLYGSWARGDAHPESDVDLLVVLDRVDSRWEERRRMDDILWRRSLESDAVLSAIPVAEDELVEPRTPLLVRARDEGVAVA